MEYISSDFAPDSVENVCFALLPFRRLLMETIVGFIKGTVVCENMAPMRASSFLDEDRDILSFFSHGVQIVVMTSQVSSPRRLQVWHIYSLDIVCSAAHILKLERYRDN